MITLHHLNRSRSHRILWLLEEIGVDYDVKHYARDAKTSLAPPELLAIHPLGKSPMIEMDGRLITESAAIVERLCTKQAPHMIPAHTSDAYIQHLELMHFAEGSAMTPILLNLYVGKLGGAGKPLHPRIQHQLDSHFGYMNDVLGDTGHYVLDDLSAVDIMLSFPAEIAMMQDRAADFPRLAQFVERIHARPAYQRATAKGAI
ncbi:glutathione S-transferase N-terminal domain-containing protein [Pseudosulfitobacter sp. SM2401]|uniref:glutathione S-transferase family protein n=1 Tax=Pseudosulfitobacter sp. SM2401 TaxID=3350098 RepID=UPI0036F2366E